MSGAKVPDYDTCGLFHRLHCIKTLASRPVLICKSYYFFARKEAAGILSYSQFRFFVYFTFLFKLGKLQIYLKLFYLSFIYNLPIFYSIYTFYFGLLIFCCQSVAMNFLYQIYRSKDIKYESCSFNCTNFSSPSIKFTSFL